MSEKKINPILFMILATLFNLVLIAVIFVLLTLVMSFVSSFFNMNEGLYTISYILVIVLTFVFSFLIYAKVMKIVSKKWQLDGWKRR